MKFPNIKAGKEAVLRRIDGERGQNLVRGIIGEYAEPSMR